MDSLPDPWWPAVWPTCGARAWCRDPRHGPRRSPPASTSWVPTDHGRLGHLHAAASWAERPVQRFTLEFIEAARLSRHAPGDRWFTDETYVKVSGRWAYRYRAVDQHGQVIDVLLSDRRDLAAARRSFTRALRVSTIPAEVTTDRAPAYPRILDELIPSALHTVEQYANNPVETDHGRLKARLRPMRGLERHQSARIVSAGHAFVQNISRGHCQLAIDVPGRHRLRHCLRPAHACHLTSKSCSGGMLWPYRPASQRNIALQLHYVEFFSGFFEEGGQAFRPFGRRPEPNPD